MEALGGGGHFTNAATQLSNSTIAEAKEQLLDAINKQLTEGTEE
jgi:c-di-AMP phosphodiesterase-like protein